MPLLKQLVPIPFAGGLDTKTDPLQVAPGKMVQLQNAIFRQTGSIGRRWGYTALGQGILGSVLQVSKCQAIQPFRNELLLFDGIDAYSYIPDQNAWAIRANLTSVIQSNKTIVSDNNQQLSPDHGALSGVELYAWEDSRGGIRYLCADQATGALLFADRALAASIPSTARAPKVFGWTKLGGFIVFYDDGAGNLSYVTVSSSAITTQPASGSVLLNYGASLSPIYYDVCLDQNGNLFLAARASGSGSINTFTILSLGVSGGSPTNIGGTTLTVGGVTPTGGVSCCLDSVNAHVWVSFTESVASDTVVLSQAYTASGVSAPVTSGSTLTTLTQTGTPTAVQAVTSIVTAGSLCVYAEAIGNVVEPYNQRIWLTFVTNLFGTPSVGASSIFARSVGLASKPFVANNILMINVAFQSPLQSTYFTLDPFGNVVAKSLPDLGGGLIGNSDWMLPEVTQATATSTNIFKYCSLVRGQASTEAGGVVSLLGVNATTLDFQDTPSFASAEINDALYTVGGVLLQYDGVAFVENNFHVYPEGVSAAPSGSGGLLSAGVYNYCVTYESTDSNGQTDISSPSVALAVTTTTGTSSVTLTIPTLRLTRKQNVKIVIYRTAVNGTTLTRVTSAIAPFYNNTQADSISFTDTLSDASIAGNSAMYTQPLVLGSDPVVPNNAPPSCSLIALYADRVWVNDNDNPSLLYFSQQAIATSPMQFSSLLFLQLDPEGGAVTALQRQDANLIIFKETAIFAVLGQGPTATGDSNDLGLPVQIPSGGVGCVNAASVVLTPIGILFQSANGIYLLDRGLNVTYKGAPVEQFNSLAITSATLIPNQWVVFTTTTGTAIVYDFFYDQWSTFLNHTAVASCLYAGDQSLLAIANPNTGIVWLQTPSAFSDPGPATIPVQWMTAPFNPNAGSVTPGAIGGYQRVYHALLTGQFHGAAGTTHTLTINAAFDYGTSFATYATIPIETALASDASGNAQFRVDLLQKCTAVQLQGIETQVGGGDQGMQLSAITMVIAVKTGLNKLPLGKLF